MLQSLYERVVITDAVYVELGPCRDNTLASVSAAISQGWLTRVTVSITDRELVEMLDPGEASSILYSLDHNRIPLLIDERRGKRIAKARGIPVIGTAGVLVKSKQANLIPLVKPLLIDMQAKGYWLSDPFIRMVAAMVGEE